MRRNRNKKVYEFREVEMLFNLNREITKKQRRLNTDYKEYTVIKQNSLKEILALSGKVKRIMMRF